MSIRPNYRELDATKTPTALDIAWAAGVYEGEGNCRLCGRGKRSFSLAVAQKESEILIRLRDWFGGSISLPSPGYPHSCHVWNACGDRSRIFMALIYPFLSSRRKLQADETGVLEFLGESSSDGLSMDDLRSKLEAFNQTLKVPKKTSEDRSAEKKAYYEKRKLQDANYLTTLAIRNKAWREKKSAATNVVSIDRTA